MEPNPIEFNSSGEWVRGRFYPAVGSDEPATLLFVPGWPADPSDFLGLGPALSPNGINVMEFFPRGMQSSEGTYTHSKALLDIKAALEYLRRKDVLKQYNVDPARLVLGGFSNGGGLAMAYAAHDSSVRKVISCASNDFGEFARQMQSNAAMAETVRTFLRSTHAPVGSARFDLEPTLQELIDHPEIFGLRENAAKLADRSILMFGGWEDTGPTIELFQLPLYRALKDAGAKDITFIVYHTDHSFSNVYQRLATDIVQWLHNIQN